MWPSGCRQRNRVVRRVVFTTAIIARLMNQLHPSLAVSSLNKMLHSNYLCLEEFKQIEEVRSKIQAQKSETRATPRRVRFHAGLVPCIAPPSLSRDRRIKMKKSSSRTDELFEKNQHIFCMLFSS